MHNTFAVEFGTIFGMKIVNLWIYFLKNYLPCFTNLLYNKGID